MTQTSPVAVSPADRSRIADAEDVNIDHGEPAITDRAV